MNNLCPYCKKTIHFDSAFCINCGSDLRQQKSKNDTLSAAKIKEENDNQYVICSNCQKYSPLNSNFCVHCGEKINILKIEPERPSNNKTNFADNLTKRLYPIFNVIILVAAILSIAGYINLYVKNKLSISVEKDSKNEEIIGNLYRNTKYKFRIKFPKNWKIENGDGPNVLIKASNTNGSSISIIVKDFGVSFGEIDEMITLDEWAESVYEKFPDAKIQLKKETQIDNKKAFIVKSSFVYKSLDKEVNLTSYSVALTKKNFLFTITGSSDTKSFESESLLLEKSISTFVSED